jgi:hypothetical protein
MKQNTFTIPTNMKRIITQTGKAFAAILLLVLLGHSGYAVNRVSFSAGNIVSTSTSVSIDVFITDSSLVADPPIVLTGFSVGITFDTLIKNGGTCTVAFTANSWDQTVTNLDHLYGATQVFGVSTTAGGAGKNQIQLQVANTNVTCASTGNFTAPQ